MTGRFHIKTNEGEGNLSGGNTGKLVIGGDLKKKAGDLSFKHFSEDL